VVFEPDRYTVMGGIQRCLNPTDREREGNGGHTVVFAPEKETVKGDILWCLSPTEIE
jgi:hypothetical protein